MKTKLLLFVLFFCFVGHNTSLWSQDGGGPDAPPPEEIGPDSPPASTINDFIYVSLIAGAFLAGKKIYSVNKKK